MKYIYRFIAILFLLAIPFQISARELKWEWRPSYSGELHLGYRTTTSVYGYNTYTGNIQLGTLQGVTLNDFLGIYAGLDAVMFTHYYHGEGLRWAITPYLDLRPSFPITDKFKVFIDLGLGAYIGIKPTGGSEFFCQFGPGFRFRKFNVSTGLQSIGTGKGTVGYYVKLGLYF